MDYRDVYVEHLVKRVPDAFTALKKAGIVAGIFLLPFILFLIEYTRFLTPAAFALCVWGGVKLYKLQNVEFEYIVTNGELDVDRISGKSKRRRILTVDSRSFEIFAPFCKDNEREYSSDSIKKILDVSSSKHASGRWFALFSGKDGVRTLLILDYNEKVANAMKPFIPRRAFFNR